MPCRHLDDTFLTCIRGIESTYVQTAGKDRHNAQQHEMNSLDARTNPTICEEKSTGFAKKRPVFEEKSTVFSLYPVSGASETISRHYNGGSCGSLSAQSINSRTKKPAVHINCGLFFLLFYGNRTAAARVQSLIRPSRRKRSARVSSSAYHASPKRRMRGSRRNDRWAIGVRDLWPQPAHRPTNGGS